MTHNPCWHALPRPQWAALEKINQSQDWFEVYRVAPEVFAIYEPGHFEEVISYLILGEKRAALIDTGMGIGNMMQLVRELTPLEVLVLNSHTHFDHVGDNYQFNTIYAIDTEITRVRSEGMRSEEVREIVEEEAFSKTPPPGFTPEQYEIKPFTISHFIKEGDRIDIGGRILEVLYTPGHAPDEICFLDRANRLLFTADAFYPAPMYVHLPGSDFDTYAETAERLAAIVPDIDWLLPAHNYTPVEANALTRLHEAFQAIQKGTAAWTPYEDNCRKYVYEDICLIVPEDG